MERRDWSGGHARSRCSSWFDHCCGGDHLMMAFSSAAALFCACLLPLAPAQFIPADPTIQVGYPTGFRAFIPDFPGCQMFSFHAKINTPFQDENDLGTYYGDVTSPNDDGFWNFQDLDAKMNPGDTIHYWTSVIKDGVEFPKYNLTALVPDLSEAVDLLSSITQKPPTTENTLPEKMRDTEPTTPSEEATTPTTSTTPSTTTTTTTTEAPTTRAKKSTTPSNPLSEVEELATATTPLDKPLAGEFPSTFFPLPAPFPRPKPMMPPGGPGFEICSNPWNFEEQLGETRTQRLERQVVKLQCQLAIQQRGYGQLASAVETELTDLKKLVYGMVSRMSRLENVLRSAAFG